MALKLYERYPQLWESPSNDYPQGAFKNLSAQGETDGSYLEKDWLNDYSGFFGALLRNAEMTPDGTIDTAQRSQFYDALVKVAKKSVTDALNKKWDIQATVGSGKVMREGSYGLGGRSKYLVNQDIDNIELSNGFYDYGDLPEFDYPKGVIIKGISSSIYQILFSSFGNKAYLRFYNKETPSSEFEWKTASILHSLNTSTDSSGFLRTSGSKETFTKDLVTQSTGSSTTSVMSQKAVTDQLNSIERSRGLGYGQSWVDVTRDLGVLYTNTTKKPIAVNFLFNHPSGSSYTFDAYVDEVLVGRLDGFDAGAQISIIVPPESSYKLNLISGKNIYRSCSILM